MAERLRSLGLAPPESYTIRMDADGHRTESISPGQWRVYLAFIFPYVETFGVERALEETRRQHEEIAREAERNKS